MAVTKAKKDEILQQLANLFDNAKSVVFADYKGLSVKDMRILRKKMITSDVKYKVAKKTLIKIAAEKAGFKEIPDSALEGQVGAAFSMGDEIGAAKALYEFSKTNENIKLLGALMEGRSLSQTETLALAKIPGKEQLLAQLVGSMKAPISGFHGVLYALLQNFVGVVDAYREKLDKEGPVAEAPAETKEEAPAEAKDDSPREAAEAKEETPAEAKAEGGEEAPVAETPAETPTQPSEDKQ